MKQGTFYLLSLGCPKNEVDSECMSALLKQAGFIFERDPKFADFLIVNTCAFIEPAVDEAIEAILDMAALKTEREGDPRLIVTGCLAQRYKEEIFREFPQIDAILGTGEYGSIVTALQKLSRGENLRGNIPGLPGDVSYLDCSRIPSAPPGTYAYLKIAEGCSNACAYCAIPKLRGPQESRQPDLIVREARHLAGLGVRELIVIAQDTTRYGWDLPKQPSLASLLRRITQEVSGINLVRCLYFYADALTDELIEEMATNPKIAHYVDLPIQHASNAVLEKMRRHETIEMISRKIDLLRDRIPDIILRTTVMTGFPGETEDDFKALLSFVKAKKFDRLGCFVFSPEEGTVAARLPDKVDPDTASRRRDLIMKAQHSIAWEANRKRVGELTPVIFEGIDDRGILFQGRSYGEAPEIDPVIFVAATTPDLRVGSRPLVRIIDAGPYELIGESLNEHCE
ncbi:MAG TPA: 30S ribosomal protein S12 methylthiotransferase RimO [Clostridia bacterium]|nr:30S ribosomal protein S12 methylthiotransferase RimO [Clostridia bacterium]